MSDCVRWTEFRGRGFWSRDGLVPLWLALLVDELDRQDALGWKRRMRDDWLTQASIRFDGLISAQLDDHIDDEHKRRDAIALFRGLRENIGASVSSAVGTGVSPPVGPLAVPAGQHAARIGAERWEREDTAGGLLRLADSFLWLLEHP